MYVVPFNSMYVAIYINYSNTIMIIDKLGVNELITRHQQTGQTKLFSTNKVQFATVKHLEPIPPCRIAALILYIAHDVL